MFWESLYGQHHHIFWADNEKEARAIAKQFDFEFYGTWLISGPCEMRPSKYLQRFDRDFVLRRPELMHAVVFLSFLAARAKVVEPDTLLNDSSALHELVHYNEFGIGNPRGLMHGAEHVVRKLLALEKLIPGLPPDTVDLPFSARLKACSDQLIELPAIPAAIQASS